MARSKKEGGESNVLLVIALVFFILLSIGLGVMYYTSQQNITDADGKAKKAEDDKKAAEKARDVAQDVAKLYRLWVGTATEDEKAYMANPAAATKAEVQAEHGKLMAAANTKIGDAVSRERLPLEKLGASFDLRPVDVFTWAWPDGGALPSSPSPSPLIDRMVKFVAERERVAKLSSVEIENSKKELAALSAEKGRYTKAIADLTKSLDDKVKELAKAKEDVAKVEKDQIAKFEAEADKYRKLAAVVAQQVEEKNAELKVARDKLVNVEEQLRRYQERESAIADQTKSSFSLNVPHGKIVSVNTAKEMVEINIGSAANLKPGQTFKLQPPETATQGLPKGGDDTAKGTVEVVEVLGPNLSTARITAQSNVNRDPIIKGDLLYNPLWKKGARDHVVLYGIFDVDADGIDDIKTVAVGLERQGVIVDGYYDLAARKWASLDPKNKTPGPTQSTTYAVKGWIPEPKSNTAIAGGLSDVVSAINTAATDAKTKGCQEVTARKFFPEIGYKISASISEETVNLAAIKYVKDTPTVTSPMDK